jgi:glutaredoxin
MPAPDHQVTLVTRAGCHLCEEAERVLRRMHAELRFDYREVDVDSAAALQAEFSDRVPVILLDDREHGYWRVEEARLRRALERS